MSIGYKITVSNTDAKSFEIPTKIIGTDIIWDANVKKIKFDRYWDSHGEKVYWDDEPCWEVGPCHVKIESIHRILFGNIRSDVWNMYINGKEVTGGIDSFNYSSKTGLLKVDAPFGYG